jgi:hypothetical protein
MTINTSTAINLSTADIPSKQFSKMTSIIHKHKFRNFIPMISNSEALLKILNRNKGSTNSTANQPSVSPDFLTIEKLSELLQSTTIKAKYIGEIIEEYKSITGLEDYIKIVYKGKPNPNAGNQYKFIDDKKIINIIFSGTEKKLEERSSNRSNNVSTTTTNGQTQIKNEDINSMYTAINDENSVHVSKSNPNLSTIQIINPDLRACLKHSEELSVFFNLINTLDMSMAVPYVNIKFFLPASYKTGGNKGEERNYAVASFNNFFFGYSGDKGQDDQRFTNFAKAINGDFYLNKYTYKKPVSPNITTNTSQEQTQSDQTSTPALKYVEVEATRQEVDISMFTMPQSLVNGDEKLFGDYNAFTGDDLKTRLQPVQDKFRPFMSIESIDFDVRPTKELMSFKTATMNMVLYDKSRLNEVLSFVKPDLFGSFGSEILLQYGWQHVLGDPEYTIESELSPIGEIINSLKCYEKYQIVNSSYSIQENGQVNISLNISMKGPAEIRGTKVDLNVFNYVLTKKIALYVSQLQRAGLTDVRTGEKHLSISETNISLDDLNLKSIENLRTAFNELHEKSKTQFSGKSGILAQLNLQAARINGTINLLEKELKAQNKDISAKLNSGILSFLESNDDPYLNFERYKDVDDKPWSGFASGTSISLGKIILGLLGKLVATTYQYDEVQLIFFNLNEKAIRARGLNIAEIPVNKENFRKWFVDMVKNTKQISVEGLISIILRRYVNEKASEVYGLNKWLQLTENSETKYVFEQEEKKEKNSAAKSQAEMAQYQASILNEIKNQYYGENVKVDDINQFDLTFKLPIVRMTFDTLIHEKNEERTILRINFYDENDNPYESMFDLLGNFQNDQIKNKISEINYLVNQLNTENSNIAIYKARAEALIKELKQLGIINFYNEQGDIDNTLTIQTAKTIKIEATSELTKNRSLNSLKTLFKELLPSITFGASNSAAISANVSSMQDAKMSTVFMTRDEENSAKNTHYQMFENQNLMPTRIIPSQVSAKIIGCPIINFGQMIFFDFNTNTTVDNAYVVTGIKHSISPGKFETDLTLTLADSYAKFLANSSTIKSFIEISKNLEENQKQQDELNRKADFDQVEKAKQRKDEIEKILNRTGNYLFRISII